MRNELIKNRKLYLKHGGYAIFNDIFTVHDIFHVELNDDDIVECTDNGFVIASMMLDDIETIELVYYDEDGRITD